MIFIFRWVLYFRKVLLKYIFFGFIVRSFNLIDLEKRIKNLYKIIWRNGFGDSDELGLLFYVIVLLDDYKIVFDIIKI